MAHNIAVALITQEQMCIDTAFDFISMTAATISKDINICIISPQRARKEIAKREAVAVAERTKCESILFIQDGIRFVPETLKHLMAGKKDIVGCKTELHPEMVSTDLTLVNMSVFEKMPKPYFAVTHKEGSIDTEPDFGHFLRNAIKAECGVFCEEKLSAANQGIKCEPGIKVNARHIAGGNPTGEIIAIAFPAPGLIYTHCASDIGQMIASSIGLVRGFVLISVQIDEIETARNISQDIAEKEKASHIMFIDQDMRFPADSLVRLMRRKKKIIGVNASKRDGTDKPVMTKNLFGKKFNYAKKDTEQVKFIGMAVTLIDMKVFEKMDKPYFYPNYEDGTDTWRGEDYTFCWGARKAGFDVWCDVGLSKEIGHIGAKTYYL